jgi:hypothetical protein
MKPAGRRVTKKIPPCDGKWQESSALAGGYGELHPRRWHSNPWLVGQAITPRREVNLPNTTASSIYLRY